MTQSNGTVDVTPNGWDEARAGFANPGRLSREVNGVARVCHAHDIAGRIDRDRVTVPGDMRAGTASTGLMRRVLQFEGTATLIPDPA